MVPVSRHRASWVKKQQPHQSCIYMFMTLLQQTLHETSAIPKECHGKIMSVED